MDREPLVTVASITAGVAAVIGLLTAFGLPLNDEKTAAIMAVVAVVAPLVVAAFARPKVTPVVTPANEVGAVNVVAVLLAAILFVVLLMLLGVGINVR